MFDGTNDSLQSAATIDLSGTNKVSLAFWLWWDSFSDDGDAVLEFHSDFAAVTTGFIVIPGASTAPGFIRIAHRGDVNYTVADYARPSAAAWHHWVTIFDKSVASDECDLYLDGVLQTASSRVNSNNTNNFGDHTLNVMSHNNASQFADGRVAELAIYPGAVLNARESMALYLGVEPYRIRPDVNPYYWPLHGLESPEPIWRSGGAAMTVNGAVYTAHAPAAPFRPLGIGAGISPVIGAATASEMKNEMLLLGVGR